MNRLQKTIILATMIAFASFILMIATIASVIFIFNKETINLESSETSWRKKQIAELELKHEEQKSTIKDLSSYLIQSTDVSHFDSKISKSRLIKASSSKEEAEFIINIYHWRANELRNTIWNYNYNHKLNQFIDNNFNKFSLLFFEMDRKTSGKDYSYEKALDETVENAMNVKFFTYALPDSFNMKDTAEAFNKMLNQKISDLQKDNSTITEKITNLNQSIVDEEKRLEGVGIRITSILTSKFITLLMLVVALLTLLSIFRYSINIYNRANTQLLILEEVDNNRDISIIQLLISSNIDFDNKAEDLIVRAMEKRAEIK